MRNMISGVKGMPYTPPIPNYFCITGGANGGCSQLRIRKKGSPYPVDMEVSFDGLTWAPYTVDVDSFTLTAGEKLYFRNASTTNIHFSGNKSNYYYFGANGTYECSGDVGYLINKNSTNTIPDYGFYGLFRGSKQILTAPELPATTLGIECYGSMFCGCYGLTTPPVLPAITLNYGCYDTMFSKCPKLESLPVLPATTLIDRCYYQMFYGCSKIKLSETQTGEYQTPYRIPTAGTGEDGNESTGAMFRSTGGTFTGVPTINTTYYTSNTIVS